MNHTPTDAVKRAGIVDDIVAEVIALGKHRRGWHDPVKWGRRIRTKVR